MPTATKSSRVKTKKTVVQTSAHEEVDGAVDVLPTKNKKPLEIDELETVVGIVEEKVEEDPLVAATEEEETEEAVLDGEELNPFGDRWEE